MPTIPRLLAIILAIGGICWGVMLLGVFGLDALIPLPFGFGYLVTAGYVLRSLCVPPLFTRRLIWAASCAVQSGWCFLGVADLANGRPHTVLLWWAFATAASILSLILERKD